MGVPAPPVASGVSFLGQAGPGLREEGLFPASHRGKGAEDAATFRGFTVWFSGTKLLFHERLFPRQRLSVEGWGGSRSHGRYLQGENSPLARRQLHTLQLLSRTPSPFAHVSPGRPSRLPVPVPGQSPQRHPFSGKAFPMSDSL